jgi:predicted DNA-binding transcriptional regulator YafY
MASNKIKLLYILDILKSTDEKNPVTTNKILEKLKCHDIEAERKSILRDIEILKDYGIDVLLHKDNKKGYYIGNRDFEDWEIKMLIDSIASGKFITKDQSKVLINKLKNLSSASGKKAISSLTVVNSTWKTDNKTVKISIDLIIKAVSENKQITFNYFDYKFDFKKNYRNNKLEYIVNPYALIQYNNDYYLIGNYHKYNNLSYYLLSKISDIKALNSNCRELKEILGENSDILLQRYITKNIYMYGGNSIRLKLKCPQYMADILIRQFGEINISNVDDTSFIATIDVTDGDGLYFWLLQHSENIEVLEPLSVRDELIQSIKNILKKYNG